MCAETRKPIPLAYPMFDAEMEQAAVNALRNGRHVQGEDVFKFEEEFAEYVGSKFAISTSSGTNALHIGLLTLGIGYSDEVITSAFSFIASANSVLHAGATPVFVDIDANDFNIDHERIKRKITKRTRALLPVHLYGYPCHMHEIMSIADEYHLKVVEDACQAHGAEYASRNVGTIGDIGCFSFYPSKNMTVCGDGGMIVTNDDDIAKLAAKLRDSGRKTHYEHDVIGYTSRLNTVNAAIGRVQLRRLDEWNRRRLELASLYDKLLVDVSEISIPPKSSFRFEPVYHLYVIKAEDRNSLRVYLDKNGIQSGVHYPLPIPLQPIYKQLFKFKTGDYSVSECVSRECLSLPIYPAMTTEDVKYVCYTIKKFYCNKMIK